MSDSIGVSFSKHVAFDITRYTVNDMKGWTEWNVQLWLFNDEPTYRLVQGEIAYYRRHGGGLDAAADSIYHYLVESDGQTHTPDGAKYSRTNIRKAIVGE